MVYLDDLLDRTQLHTPLREVLFNELPNVNPQGQYSMVKVAEVMVSNNNASSKELHNLYGTKNNSFD